jgi:hypothetical protein
VRPLKWIAAFGFALALVGATLLLSQPPSPGAAALCGAGITVLLNGVPLATGASGCVLNMIAGSGIVATPKSDPAIGGTDISFALNSAVAPTRAQGVQNTDHYCVDNSGTSNGTCLQTDSAAWCASPINGYSAGEYVFYVPSVSPTAGLVALNVGGCGAMTITLADHSTAPYGKMPASGVYLLIAVPSANNASQLIWSMTQGDSK